MNKGGVFLLLLCFGMLAGCEREAAVSVKKKSAKTKGNKAEMAAHSDAEAGASGAKPAIIESSMRTNPFLTREEEDLYKKQDTRRPVNFDLSAIFYAPPKSKAVIAGRIYKEGDIVDNKEIVKINTGDVILKDGQGEYILRLKTVLRSGPQG